MRQSIGGQEKFHGAMISHADREDTKTFQEMKQLGAELKKLGNRCLEAKVNSEVGILFDWDNWWALELASGPTQDMDYLKQVHHFYRALYENNISTDILKVTANYSKYKIIIVPLLYMIKENVVERLEQFVGQGGTLIITYMSGMVDENDKCVFGAYPGKLRKLTGIWVEETDALYPDEENQMVVENSESVNSIYKCGFLCDQIHLETAEALAVYGKDFYQGKPCLTKNDYQKGSVYYFGTCPEIRFLKHFMKKICEQQNVYPYFRIDGCGEICVREGERGKTIFLINHQEEDMVVHLDKDKYWDILNEEQVEDMLIVGGRNVVVLKPL